MTLDQLRIFVAVAEREHVTRAARDLNLTQSAVSGAIAALESRHQVTLFDRVGRRIVLNETGRAFLEEAKSVLARAEAAATALDDLGTLRRGRLTIYASQTIASYWLPNRLVKFHAAHPQVELQVHIGNTREVVRAVAEGEAELGFVEGEGDHPVLARETIDRDRLIVLVPPGHAWAAGKRLAAHELQSGAWVLREPGSGTRSTLEAALASVGVAVKDLNIVMTLPSNESVLAAASAGAGATALSASVAAAAISRGQLRGANFNLPDRSYELIHHKERYLTRAAQALMEQIRADRDRALPARPEDNGSGGGI